jgi:amino acid adenylation domain-containing protein/non-ribosomal peptide synthase protein (TIGR01720 family)
MRMHPNPADRYPLAPLQRGMLFHALTAPESTMYLEQHRLDLDGDVDLAAFRAAWRSVCELHPALRTAFDTRQADQPMQVVAPVVELPLIVADWRGLSRPEQAARESAERERGFDLSRAPLFRLCLARLGDRVWRLLWTHHHLVLDGWSVGLVLRDVATAYAAAQLGDPVSLPAPPAYRDFVAWAGRQDLDRAREHWTDALAGFTEPTPLGITRSAGRAADGPPERIGHRLTRELTERLERFRTAHGLTAEALLTAAWAVVLGRYSGTDDVVFGLTSPGRSGPVSGIDRMVGLLINTLPVRARLQWDRPVAQWLRQVQDELTRTRELEQTPLDRVQAWSEVPKGRRLFDTILVVEDFPVEVSSLRLGELRVTGSASTQQTNYPLTLLAFPRERLVLEALFDAGLLDRRLIQQLLSHLEAVLDGFASAPSETVLGDVELMRPAERAELIRRGSPRAAFPCEQTGLAPARFAAWARREPDRIAVSFGEERISYRDLLTRTARLVNRLRGLGVGPGVLVGIYLPRGVDLVVAVLAVACAGGGYVPVDRRHPVARARGILTDASVAVLLTHRDAVGDVDGVRTVYMDEPNDPGPDELPGQPAQPDDVAYVIYTSGSTGAPKGVVVEHAQLARLLDATQEWFEFGPDDVWTLFHSIAFDFSVWELWGALATGGRLVVVPDEVARDPAAFRRLLLDEGVTVLNQTPSAFRGLLHADLEATPARSPYRLRQVILGGEMLKVSSLRPWLERYGDARPTVVNMYGITETTVHVTYRPITSTDLDSGIVSPIGEPIPDLAVRLVDRHGRLVPVGVPGEMHVGGAGVARGYLGRPELTAERFVADRAGRWYRTGDRARWLPAGGLEFLGRLDDQVKIRGYRIELGEVESVLNDHPQVRESVVVAVETGVVTSSDDHRQLVAYVVAAPGLSWSQLRGWLSERVPDYLVPAGFVGLDRLPLNPNGKVDRAALPAARPSRPDESAGPVAPRTETERILAEVWAEVLGLEQVGIADNFFALGGDSILTIQAVARVGRRGVAITPTQLFAHQTIAELAEVATEITGPATRAEQGEVTGEVPMTPVRAWFHGLDLPHPEHWNLPILLVARQPVRPEWLAEALTALVTHHDVLRMRLASDRAWIAPVAEHGQVPVEEFELPSPDGPEFGELVRQVQAGLDLARGPLLRAAVFRAPGDEPDRVLLAAHHLVVDTVSWQILLEDLDTGYRQVVAGAPITLPAKTTDFPSWARGLHELARSDRIAEQARWWLDRLPQLAPALPDRGDPGLEGDLHVVSAALDEPATARLLGPAQHAYRTRPDELLLAALAQAVSRWTGEPRLLVDVEGHGRDVPIPGTDVSRTVGWFTTFTPTWLDLAGIGPGGTASVVKAVKEQLRAMPDRGAPYGLGRWLRDDDLARQLAELPQAQLSFNYLGRLDHGTVLDQKTSADVWFALAPEQVTTTRHPANPRPYPIDIVAGVRDGRLHLYVSYSARQHTAHDMERLAADCIDALRAIIDHCASPGAGGPTPSDFPLAEIDQRQLDRLVAHHGGIEDLYPLTPLQRGLLFHTLADPGSGVYFEQFSIGLDGPLDIEAIERAWRALLDRHAVLRAAIAWQGLAVPHLVVHERVELPLTHHDWSDLPEERQAARLTELLTQDRVTGFDLTRAPLTRLHLIRLAERRWHLIWSHHHIILDGWSVALLIQEVFDSYEAIQGGHFVPKPPPRPYRDYLGHLASLDLSGAWAYWRRVLSGVTGPTPLGVDRPAVRTQRRDADYARVHRRLPPDRSAAVREFARAHRLTLDTVLHGAWALLLAQRSGMDDVVFGVASSGRPPALEGVEEMVGLFINTLPARVRVDRDQPVVSWLSGLLRDQVQARQFEHTPLDQIRSWTSVPPDRQLFDSGRGLENYPMDGSRYRTGSVAVSTIQTFEQSNYALTFIVVPDEALFLQVWYDALQFEPETGEHIMRTVEALVLALVADPERTVGEVLQQVPARPSVPASVPADGSTGGSADGSTDGEADRIEGLLRGLPLAREAVVTRAPDRRLAAYLVPDLTALDGHGSDGGDGSVARLAEQHVEHWRVLYDQTVTDSGRPDDPTFDIAGWNSSYTGGPIAPEAMAEWRAHTLDRIRALNPRRVLEIGCGTGLLLFGLLDDCEHYVGTDFSAVSLARVRDHLATLDDVTRAKVTLLERTADDLTGLEPSSFDVVVINSVVQYFPGAAYLERVLDAAVQAAAPGGAVFLGDLRHHGLREAFHLSVQLHRAVDLLPTYELYGRVAQSLEHERELLVDPAYLAAYAAARPEIGGLELMPKRGRHDNELTRYRYDAVLRPGPPPPAPADVTWYDWHRDMLSSSELEWLLDHADTDAVGITGVPNARVAADVEATRLLADPGGPGTAGELRLATKNADLGMDPEQLYQLGDHKGWSVAVSLATTYADGSLNALFRRGAATAMGVGDLHAAAPDGDVTPADGPLTNAPLRGRLAEALERQAWEALRRHLPEHAGRCQVVVLDELPRTADGRVDHAALPVVAEPVETAVGDALPPRTADELRLARIWEQALRSSPIDVRASFFDLGGDSLLAIRVIDEIAQVFGRDVPLAVLLQEPTIEGLAKALRAESRPWTPLVEITRGEGTPFVCVHPAGGNVLCYAELARLVAPAPFYALQARGAEGDDPPYDDVPTMAARYLADVRAQQPTGPYRLGGWSMGGLVAYEMAQQLLAAGEQVSLLALIETPTPDLIGDLPDEAAVLARLLEGRVALDTERLREMPAEQRLHHVLTEAEQAGVGPPGMDPGRARHLLDVYTTHLEAVRRYRPRPYDGPTLVLRAARSADHGWDKLLTGPWETVEVPGDHETILWPPTVQHVADVLRAHLSPT